MLRFKQVKQTLGLPRVEEGREREKVADCVAAAAYQSRLGAIYFPKMTAEAGATLSPGKYPEERDGLILSVNNSKDVFHLLERLLCFLRPGVCGISLPQ